MKSFLPAAFAAASALFTFPVRAHHGQEFFLLYDAQVQKPWHGNLQGQFSFADEGTDDSLGLSPSLNLGILPRTAFNLRADFTDESNDSWAYRSIEPGFQFDLTPPNLKLPVRFGLAIAWQFAESGGELSGHTHGAPDPSGDSMVHYHDDGPAAANHPDIGSTHDHASASTTPAHDHSTHDHGPPPVSQPGMDLGPDALTPEELAAMEAANASATPAPASATTPAPAAAAAPPKRKSKSAAAKPTAQADAHPHSSHDASENRSHSHANSIHNHEDNLFTARLIFEADLTSDTLLVGNLISVLPEEGSAAWGYAIGIRHRLRPGLALGMEALGDFDADKHQEILGAVYWEPVPHLLLKLGAGTGLSAVSPDATVRAGVLWMF